MILMMTLFYLIVIYQHYMDETIEITNSSLRWFMMNCLSNVEKLCIVKIMRKKCILRDVNKKRHMVITLNSEVKSVDCINIDLKKNTDMSLFSAEFYERIDNKLVS